MPGAPSARAQVASAAAATLAESYRVSIAPAGQPVISGEFDPARQVGVTDLDGLAFIDAGGFSYERLPGPDANDKTWIRLRLPAPQHVAASRSALGAAAGTEGTFAYGTTAEGLLRRLESVRDVRRVGPASGAGWAGSRYYFAAAPPPAPATAASAPLALSGYVDVDARGRVRQLALDMTMPATTAPPRGHAVAYASVITFGDFGVPVRVSVPPASKTDVIS